MYYNLFIALCMVNFMACSGTKPTTTKPKVNNLKFDFQEGNSLSPILDRALAEDKLVFLDLYTDWCLPCKLMNEDVYTHKSTADFFNEHFISYKVNAEKINGPDLVYLFNVKSYPGLLFLDTKGRPLQQKNGAAYPTELMQMAQKAIEMSHSPRQ